MIQLAYPIGRAGKKHFLPLLKIIAHYPFSKPLNCSCLDKENYWEERSIRTFTSRKFLQYVDSAVFQQVWLDNASSERLNLYIAQSKDSSGLRLRNIRKFISYPQMKALFMELVTCHPTCYEAVCSPDISEFLGRHFTDQQRETKNIIGWIEYFGKEALERRGGFTAFESSPYIQTQRIHDGLWVQVGDNPDAFNTPEGEALLVNAINSLPTLIH